MERTPPPPYWDDVEHHLGSRMDYFWLADPIVRRAVNRDVSGNPDVWPVEWLAERFRAELPLERSAVIGCGTGNLERALVKLGVVREITGVDIAPNAVAYAKRTAEEEGLTGIEYLATDALDFLERHTNQFDAIFFHGALHHMTSVAQTLSLTEKALRKDGLLFIDEYVGPSMHEWSWWRLLPANIAYYLAAPSRMRRPRLVRAPRNSADPSEMHDASSIVPEVRRRFDLVEQRDYGGNILGLVYANLEKSKATVDDIARVVDRLIRIERFVRRFERSHHAVIVARRRD